MLRSDDITRLRHMHDAAEDACTFLEGRTRVQLDTDRQLAYAVTFAIGVIGEAAREVSDEGRALLPMIPWSQVVAMRNRLFHGYFAVDYDRVWDTVRVALPPLVVQLRQLLSTLPGTDAAP
jgi:uncharacterized protein with HEPN domain